jgi:PIN domain nuclease of toxin-antitoxin system
VPHYFLDTSALAKLYRKEIGSDLVDRVVAEPDSRRFISRFTVLEMESVLALKFRTGEINERSMLIARRRLEADLGSERCWWRPSATIISAEPGNYS